MGAGDCRARNKQILNVKLLSKYCIKMLGILGANKLKLMAMFIPWIFRLSL